MVFDPATVKTQRTNEDADYEGVRVRFVGLLGKARVTMQIDVGFGDVVTPGAVDITYPALLDFPAPALSPYPHETVIAEKLQAMVYLRTLNSRMKDFYDVWLLARQFAFDGSVLAKAIAATFRQPRDRHRRRAARVHTSVHRAGVDRGAVDRVPKEAPEHRVPRDARGSRRSSPSSCCRSGAPAQPARASSSAGHRAGRGRAAHKGGRALTHHLGYSRQPSTRGLTEGALSPIVYQR
jgi:hypothetical protein